MNEIDQAATSTVRRFLVLLEARDLDTAMALLDDDIVYTNVSLPTIRGRRDVERGFRSAMGPMGFRVHFHHIGTDEVDQRTDEVDQCTVLTERTDALEFGPVSIRFWVWGRFDVRDGRITHWRDSFDWFDVAKGMARGILGAVIPAAQRPWPETTEGALRQPT